MRFGMGYSPRSARRTCTGSDWRCARSRMRAIDDRFLRAPTLITFRKKQTRRAMGRKAVCSIIKASYQPRIARKGCCNDAHSDFPRHRFQRHTPYRRVCRAAGCRRSFCSGVPRQRFAEIRALGRPLTAPETVINTFDALAPQRVSGALDYTAWPSVLPTQSEAWSGSDRFDVRRDGVELFASSRLPTSKPKPWPPAKPTPWPKKTATPAGAWPPSPSRRLPSPSLPRTWNNA